MLLQGQRPAAPRPPVPAHYSFPLPAQAHLDGTLGLHKPASQHGLRVLVAQLRAGSEDLLLHLGLQQQPAQPPVEEGACSLPFQHILWTWPPEAPMEEWGKRETAKAVPQNGYLAPAHLIISRDVQCRGMSVYLGQ